MVHVSWTATALLRLKKSNMGLFRWLSMSALEISNTSCVDVHHASRAIRSDPGYRMVTQLYLG